MKSNEDGDFQTSSKPLVQLCPPKFQENVTFLKLKSYSYFFPKFSLYWLWDIFSPHPFNDDDDDDDDDDNDNDDDDDDDDDDDYNDGDSLVIKRKDWE